MPRWAASSALRRSGAAALIVLSEHRQLSVFPVALGSSARSPRSRGSVTCGRACRVLDPTLRWLLIRDYMKPLPEAVLCAIPLRSPMRRDSPISAKSQRPPHGTKGGRMGGRASPRLVERLRSAERQQRVTRRSLPAPTLRSMRGAPVRSAFSYLVRFRSSRPWISLGRRPPDSDTRGSSHRAARPMRQLRADLGPHRSVCVPHSSLNLPRSIATPCPQLVCVCGTGYFDVQSLRTASRWRARTSDGERVLAVSRPRAVTASRQASTSRAEPRCSHTRSAPAAERRRQTLPALAILRARFSHVLRSQPPSVADRNCLPSTRSSVAAPRAQPDLASAEALLAAARHVPAALASRFRAFR